MESRRDPEGKPPWRAGGKVGCTGGGSQAGVWVFYKPVYSLAFRTQWDATEGSSVIKFWQQEWVPRVQGQPALPPPSLCSRKGRVAPWPPQSLVVATPQRTHPLSEQPLLTPGAGPTHAGGLLNEAGEKDRGLLQ